MTNKGAEGRKYDRAGGDAEVRRPPPFRPTELVGDSLDVWCLHRDLVAVRRARPWLATGTLNVTQFGNRTIIYEVVASAGRLVVALNIDDEAIQCKTPAVRRPVAGHPDADLPLHGWAAWGAKYRFSRYQELPIQAQ